MRLAAVLGVGEEGAAPGVNVESAMTSIISWIDPVN